MKSWLIILIILVLAGVGYAVYGHEKKSTPYTANTTSTKTTSSSTTKPTATDAVVIKDMAFSPASITVQAGATVTWTNNDTMSHTITETDGKTGPDSSDVAPGGTYSFTYKTVGTFKYHCTIHPSMTGTVTVTPST